jgi:hypothetical protein
VRETERRFLTHLAGLGEPYAEDAGAELGLGARLVRAYLLKWSALGWWDYCYRPDAGRLSEKGRKRALSESAGEV